MSTYNIDNRLAERARSSFPLSIGTGLAMESMFEPTDERYDNEREIPNKVNLKLYNKHIWNIYTIIRNILYAVQDEKDKQSILMDPLFKKVLIEEIENLFFLYQHNNCNIVPVLYIPTYDYASKKYNKEKIVTPTKPMLEIPMIASAIKAFKLEDSLKHHEILKSTDSHLPNLEGKVLLTTHIAVDLITSNKITLLESNSGKLRERYDWHNKFHNIGNRSLEMIPFIEETLFILGDMTVVAPVKLAVRLELYQLAIDKHWTARTSRDRIRMDMKRNPILYPYTENI